MLQYCYENAAEKRQFIIERDISNMNERLERSRSAAKGQGSPSRGKQSVGGERKPYTSGKRKRRGRKRQRCIRRMIQVLVIAAVVVYLLFSLKYNKVFLPNTVIGGISVSGMDLEEVKSKITEGISGYELVVEERDGKEERILGRDIGLAPVFDGCLETILEYQNPLLWGIRCIKGEEYGQDYMVSFDKGKFEQEVLSLACLKPEQTREPEDAHLAYVSGEGLQIIPEKYGNCPDPQLLLEETEKAVAGLQQRISLEQEGVYKSPEILEHDPDLKSRLERWKPYADTVVTYRFGSRSEVLDGTAIMRWLSDDENGTVVIDRSKAEAYVQGLAKKYNTAYKAKELKTSYGPTVSITKGHYGWMIDQQKETDELTAIILSGKSREREPVYLQTAASHDGPDYGTTYVEMNLTAQHLYYYKDGRLLVESDFVSGNEAKGWSTPAGAYDLTYKQRNAVLRGKNYNTPVTYWMPFNGNIGMHDGYWRSSFGGTIYKKNGSHGCINLPPAVAKTIFENIEAGIPVLCYHLEGTEEEKTTNISSGKTSPSGQKEDTKPTSADMPTAQDVQMQTGDGTGKGQGDETGKGLGNETSNEAENEAENGAVDGAGNESVENGTPQSNSQPSIEPGIGSGMESGPDTDIPPGSGVDAGIVPGTGSKIGPGGDGEAAMAGPENIGPGAEENTVRTVAPGQ